MRLPLTPHTMKSFVFISSALREKSAALLGCVPYMSASREVFKEFSDICTVPFFSVNCSHDMTMKNLMHVLNGAALGGVWVLLEHVDRLEYTHLITLSKEV